MKIRRKDVVEFLEDKVARGDYSSGTYGDCTTCSHYGRAIVCGECYNGSRYCCAWRVVAKDDEEEIKEYILQNKM